MTIWTSAFGIGLIVWFAASVLDAVGPLRGRLYRIDPFALLDEWGLFVKPRAVEPVLLSRSLLRDGTITEWRQVAVIEPRRRADFVWNPGLRSKRTFLGLATNLMAIAADDRQTDGRNQMSEGSPGAAEAMTRPDYLTLLGVVTARAEADSDAVQFMLVAVRATTGPAQPGARVAFVSEVHRVRPQSATT